jgi:hypothetical protein
MKVLTAMSLMTTLLIPVASQAEDWEAAYFVFAVDPGCTPTSGKYIKIISSVSTQAGNECYNDTYLTRYTVYVGAYCGDEDPLCSNVLIDVDNLSGTYEVLEKTGACLKLQNCTP